MGIVGFEKPLATSEIHSGEKNAEKKEELYSPFFDVLVHTYGALYIGQQITQEEGVSITPGTSRPGVSVTLGRYFS